MNIVLDTNILHQEGLRSRDMQMLSRLSKSHKVNVYIPELVKREYLSKKIDLAKDDLLQVARRLDNIKKWIVPDNSISEDIREIERKFRELHQNVEEPIKVSFDTWVDEHDIIVVEFESINIDSVLNDYFSGDGVFRKAKNREDLPDAMILTTIKNIIEIEKDIIVVIKDGAFRNHLNSIDGVVTFYSLSEVFDFIGVKRLIEELDSESKRIESIREILFSEDVQLRLNEYLISERSYLDSVYLSDKEILFDGKMDVDPHHSEIEGIGLNTVADVEFGEVKFTDDNSFSIEVTFKAEAVLKYMMDYGSYHHLSDDRKSHINMGNMSGDRWCELSEKLIFNFSGFIEIWLDEEMSPEEFKVHTQYIKTDDSELAPYVEVKLAVLEGYA